VKILKKEISRNINSFFWWFLSYALLVLLMCFKTSAIVGVTGNDQMQSLMAVFPPILRNIFGIGVVDFNTVEGVFSLMFLYMCLVATFYAVISGSNLILKEENTIEFLYVKPVSRNKILTSKVICGLIYIIIFNFLSYIVIRLCSSLVFNYSMVDYSFNLVIGQFMMMIIFFSLGLLLTVVFKDFKEGQNLAITCVVAAFIYYLIVLTLDSSAFPRFISPFLIYKATDLLYSGLSIMKVFGSLIFSIGTIILTFFIHRSRDF